MKPTVLNTMNSQKETLFSIKHTNVSINFNPTTNMLISNRHKHIGAGVLKSKRLLSQGPLAA
jgi:hypothetical protein